MGLRHYEVRIMYACDSFSASTAYHMGCIVPFSLARCDLAAETLTSRERLKAPPAKGTYTAVASNTVGHGQLLKAYTHLHTLSTTVSAIGLHLPQLTHHTNRLGLTSRFLHLGIIQAHKDIPLLLILDRPLTLRPPLIRQAFQSLHCRTLEYAPPKVDITFRILVTGVHFRVVRQGCESRVKRLVHLRWRAFEESAAASDE